MTLFLYSLSLIGLLQGRGQTYGMMTIMMMVVFIGIMVMKINFLSGTMAIKNGRLRRRKLKNNFFLLLGIHQGGGIGARQKMKKGTQKHYWHKYGLFCIW